MAKDEKGEIQSLNPTKIANPMKVCDCRVHIDKDYDVGLFGVTPAEVLLLTVEHNRNAGKAPIHAIENAREIDRNSVQEISRLRLKYGDKKVGMLFHGAMPQLPKTFEEAEQAGIAFKAPEAGLTATSFAFEVKV